MILHRWGPLIGGDEHEAMFDMNVRDAFRLGIASSAQTRYNLCNMVEEIDQLGEADSYRRISASGCAASNLARPSCVISVPRTSR